MKMKKSYLAVPLSAALLIPAAGVSAHGHEDHSKMSHSSGKVSLDVSSPASDLRATLDQLLSEHAYLAVRIYKPLERSRRFFGRTSSSS
ncbi:hypothetical protein [Exiguobacterium antarcticum]|uniref:hypothetical protein n=1 Tax=Exiguobacterium antarcticum TaxID=132920 RepID=UPI000285E712|nr:hypothetical protein [Exiguobacterium antarcticum]AFS69433.1 Hypothetical protein Eab7_0271 [Exiguobacterium antarcticum B7]